MNHLKSIYKDYYMLPICVEQADEVALTLDKLIKRRKIPKHGIFCKYLKAVLQVYINPSEYSWDPEVIEFFKTLKWSGGKSTVNERDLGPRTRWTCFCELQLERVVI